MQFIIGRQYLITRGICKGTVVTAVKEDCDAFYFVNSTESHIAVVRSRFKDLLKPLYSSDNPFNNQVGGI